MKSPSSLLVTATVSLACTLLSGAASAQTIGIDFTNGTVANSTGQTPAAGTAVGPYATTGYNEVNVSASPSGAITLTNNSGVSGGMLTFSQGGTTLNGRNIINTGYGSQGGNDTTLNNDQQLFNGSVASNPNNGQQFTLSNIPYAQYSVYVLVHATRVANDTPHQLGSVQLFNGGTAAGASTTYFFQDSNLGGGSIPPASNGSVAYTQATGTTLDTATTGANYVLFTGLTNSTTTFAFTDNTPANQNYTPDLILSGIEIVNTAAVPEPSTYALLLAGIGLLVIMVRRRQAV